MQIQRHLFRISQRALKSQSATFWTQKLLYFFSGLAIVFSLCLIFGHTFILNHNTDLSRCVKAANLEFQADQFYYVTDSLFSQSQLEYYGKEDKIISKISECTVIKNKNRTINDESNLVFGWDQAGMFMNNQKKDTLKYNNVTFSLNQVQTLRKIIFNFDVLIINQILDNPFGVFPFTDRELMIRSRSAVVFHVSSSISTFKKIELLGKVIISFIIISIVTSLYIYGTIVAAPAVILLILRCCRFLRADGMNDVFKLFPWIGIHAIIRETSTTPIIKQSTSQICKAILYYFLFLYMVYYATIIWIDKKLFISHTEFGLQEIIFGYIAMTEFAAVVFMRTKTFLKYFPSFHSLIVISILYYCQICDFGFKKIACYAAFSLGGVLFTWMILNLEIPAHTTWDQANPNTPREDRPRIGYFPLFNMSWLKNLPDEWTIMMPLFGRENFTARELALVDRNNDLLAEALGNA